MTKIKDMTIDERRAYGREHYRMRMRAILSCPSAKDRYDEHWRAYVRARKESMTEEERSLAIIRSREAVKRFMQRLKADPERYEQWRKKRNEYYKKRRHDKKNTEEDIQ